MRDAHLEEYRVLKAEQAQRIGSRNALMYSTLAAVAFAGAGAVQAGEAALLLALPFACAVLGWTRLREDVHVVAIRMYIHGRLAPKVADPTGSEPVFEWESGPRALTTKLVQLVADLITFVVPGVLGVLIWLVSAGPAGLAGMGQATVFGTAMCPAVHPLASAYTVRTHEGVFGVAAALGVLTSGVLAALIIHSADLTNQGEREGEEA